MNVLTLVFSLLLIISYGFYASWTKHAETYRVQKTYVGHQKANRKLVNHCQSAIYSKLRSQKTSQSEEKSTSSPAKQNKPKVNLNRECSKINLNPLIQEGRESHPYLYELTAKMLRTFYSCITAEKRFEYHLLDTLLQEAKVNPSLSLEKLNLGKWQKLYYKMLKGTKHWSLADKYGYPTLLDYVKVENQEQKICLFHAHTDLIAAIFNVDIAIRLHEEIHKENAALLTKELIERICSENHLIAVDAELFNFLELGNPHHEEFKKTFLAKDDSSGICLRKQIHLR